MRLEITDDWQVLKIGGLTYALVPVEILTPYRTSPRRDSSTIDILGIEPRFDNMLSFQYRYPYLYAMRIDLALIDNHIASFV